MATTAAMMASSASLVQCLNAGSIASSSPQSRYSRNASLISRRFTRVRCMADPKADSGSPPRPLEGATPLSPLSGTPTSRSPSKRKISTKFEDLFAFSGPAPEIVNGRLAMLGFVAALGVELKTGEGLLTQISNGGVIWFILASALVTCASLVPLFKGVTPATRSGAIFSSDAEILNGRAAMIGMVALAITEYIIGNPLIDMLIKHAA